MSNEKESFNVKEYLDKIVVDSLEKFNIFLQWNGKDKSEFKRLLDDLRRPYDSKKETTKSKGDRLEKLVSFIIKKSYFFEIFQNVHTETNEIDEVVILSDKGKQALKSFDLSRDLIPIKEDIFLGECKNYDKNCS